MIPADGFYEWQAQGKVKQPYLYEVEGKPFAVAGVWEPWYGPEGKSEQPLLSCSIITTQANELAAKVHDRMPVILDAGDYSTWLDPVNEDVRYMLDPFPADRRYVRPVSRYVNNARNEGSDCILNSA